MMYDDDAPSHDHEMASAYLDGEATAEERATVAASPELLAIVESFRKVRTTLADTPQVDDTTREVALSAALTEFDLLGAAPDAAVAATARAIAPPNVVALSKRRWTRVLSAAAAVILIGVVGVAALNSMNGTDSDSSSSQSGTDQFIVAGDAEKTQSAESRPTQTIGAIDNAAATVPQLSDPSQLLSLAEPARTDSIGGGATETTSAPAADTIASEISTAATQVSGTPDDGLTPSPAYTFSCPLTEHQIILGEIMWKDTAAIAVRDTVTGVTQALDHQCNVLVSVSP